MAKVKTPKKVPNATPTVVDSIKESLYVDPAEVAFSKNSRDTSADPLYAGKVTQRAVSIYDRGQLQPAAGYRDADGKIVLFAGRTRADAVKLIREGFQANDKTYHDAERKLWVSVDPVAQTEEQAYVNSTVENVSRDDLNPIQEAIVIETLRGYGWADSKIAREVFGIENTNRISKLTAIRGNLGDKYQDLIAVGKLGVYPAFDLIQVSAEARDALIAKATDPETGRVDGSIIRNHLQRTAELSVSPEPAGEDEAEAGETEEKPQKDKAPAVPKRSAKDLGTLYEGLKNDEKASPFHVAVAAAMLGWMKCEYGETALFNRLNRAAELL